MSGISSKALNGVAENKFKFNGIEHNNDFDLNMYDAHYRNLDPQIGRFWQVDPKPSDSVSLYAFSYNNPIRYFDPLGDTIGISILNPGYEKPVIRSEEKEIKKKQKNDGVFILLSHGHSGGIGYVDGNGNELVAETPELFNELMSAQSPEWKEAIENGKEITLIMLGCNNASEEYITDDGRKIERSETFAEKLTTANKNLTVIAANGYVLHANVDGVGKTVGVSNHKNNGAFLMIRNGKEVFRLPMNIPNDGKGKRLYEKNR